jgi:hypothetical protein
MKTAVLSMALFIIALTAGADLLLYEGFDYPSDGINPESGLTGRNGGVGFTGPWRAPEIHPVNTLLPFGVHQDGLTFSKNGTALDVSGGCAYSQMMIPTWTHDQQERDTVNLGIGVAGNTRWFSLLVHLADIPLQQQSPAPNMGWWSIVRFSGIDNAFGKIWSGFKWGMEYPFTLGTIDIDYGQTALLVLKVTYGSTGQTNTLWVNPTPATSSAVLAPIEPASLANVPMLLAGITNRINMTSSNQGYMDEIRVGTTYYDVAPGVVETVNTGTLQFSPASYATAESGDWVTVTVTREGGSSGPASVTFATLGGTATSGADFSPAGGTLYWADGDVSPKTLDVQILRDGFLEDDETFLVHLSSATGATMGSTSMATVTIYASNASFADYDGDGRADLAVFDTAGGFWYVSTLGSSPLAWRDQWGWSTAKPVPGDYDGDGAWDQAVFDTIGGYWYIKTLDNRLLAWRDQWGWSTAKPVAGDYDGDGAWDQAVFDTMGGFWYIKTLANRVLAWRDQWGWSTAKPVSGDYDGDSVWDQAVFDTVGGYWYIKTLDNRMLAWRDQWGWSTAKPVAGDYDGDGVWDQAVFDTVGGYWYIKTQDDRVLAWGLQWGWSTARPVSGDFDGDGVFDLAVFDTATGKWYIRSLDGRILIWDATWGWKGAIAPTLE